MLHYALYLSYHFNTEAVLFAFLSSGWATTTGRLLGPKMGNSIKCLSQGHSDALPHRESNLSITSPALYHPEPRHDGISHKYAKKFRNSGSLETIYFNTR